MDSHLDGVDYNLGWDVSINFYQNLRIEFILKIQKNYLKIFKNTLPNPDENSYIY